MPTLLYVEDHPPAQMLMQAIINELTSHQLLCAGTGEAAQKLAAEHEVDLYILDFDLPDTDGLTLAQNLIVIHPAPVVLVSAYAEVIKTQTLAHYYLAKPLDPDNVAKIIQRALAGQ
jgi:CheY-like chemotaxis protein